MSAAPAAISHNPLRRIAHDVVAERRARGGYPPGLTGFSAALTHRMATDPSVSAPGLRRRPRHGYTRAD